MGSNMAECHPVGFQWAMEAKERGAKVIHVDPRFTRTSAMAVLHVPIRAGSDDACRDRWALAAIPAPIRAGSDVTFLAGVILHILENGREFREYVKHFTNGP